MTWFRSQLQWDKPLLYAYMAPSYLEGGCTFSLTIRGTAVPCVRSKCMKLPAEASRWDGEVSGGMAVATLLDTVPVVLLEVLEKRKLQLTWWQSTESASLLCH